MVLRGSANLRSLFFARSNLGAVSVVLLSAICDRLESSEMPMGAEESAKTCTVARGAALIGSYRLAGPILLLAGI
jgi:hypothetical protein